MKSEMKYVVMFNNHVGNVYSKNIEGCIESAKAIVSYGLASVATILRILPTSSQRFHSLLRAVSGD